MKHFSEEDVLALKKSEQGGGFCGVFASLIVFILVAAVVAVGLSIGEKQGTAVPTTATAISGPTELVLLPTPTLRPSVTPVAAVLEVAATPIPATATSGATPTIVPTYTPLPTYTAVPTQTPQPTHTAAATFTPPATYTPLPTLTPYPTPTAVPLMTVINDYQETRLATAVGLGLFGGLLALGTGLVLYAVRPSDRDLRRIQKLLEMHLMAALRPSAPVQALPAPSPAPVRTTPLHEWQRSRVAPVQNTGVAPVTPVTPVQNTGAALPETITVSVQPAEPGVDMATMQAICDLWNEISERGERPSFNRVCGEFFGSKNSDRLAIIRRAVKWGREQGFLVGVHTAVSETDAAKE